MWPQGELSKAPTVHDCGSGAGVARLSCKTVMPGGLKPGQRLGEGLLVGGCEQVVGLVGWLGLRSCVVACGTYALGRSVLRAVA